jgi:hypothetical protein
VLRADGRLRPGALLLRPLAPPIEQDVDPFDCGGGVRVAQAIADAIQRARALAGVAFRVASPPCAATRRCPANLAADHARGGATHLVNLDRDQARIADITALWGVDVHSVRSESARAARAVKVLRPGAPADALSFVAIRGGTTREIHLATVAQGAARRVESRVDGAVWRNLAQSAQQRSVPYVLTKSRYPEASLHRQWGHEDTIDWLLALATFYLSQTGQFLGVGDVSHVLGEEMTDHGSHRVGRDVDLYVVDFPNQSTGIPRMFWCEGDDATALTLRPRTPPASASQSFGPMGAPLAGTELDTVRRRYATILAYCLLTWDRLNTVAWHGAQWLRADAQAIARTAAGSWNTAWGPAPSATTPAGPAKASELARKLVGQGHADYGAGRGWPPHQDHLHVRLTT